MHSTTELLHQLGQLVEQHVQDVQQHLVDVRVNVVCLDEGQYLHQVEEQGADLVWRSL